jgi:hypothetical protein
MALRGLLSAASLGTNDIYTWEEFAHIAGREGVLWMYPNVPGWNHPPLTGYLAAWLLRLSEFTGLRFPVAFKLVPIAADGLCLVLLWKIWRRRSVQAAAPLAAVAIFSFSPDAILVSAYHGNNDPLVGLFVLAACYFVGVPAPFPKVLGNGMLGKAALQANLALIRLSKTLFSYQIFVLARSTPDVNFVLKHAKEKSAAAAP